MDWTCRNPGCAAVVAYQLRVCTGCGLPKYPTDVQLARERERRAGGG